MCLNQKQNENSQKINDSLLRTESNLSFTESLNCFSRISLQNSFSSEEMDLLRSFSSSAPSLLEDNHDLLADPDDSLHLLENFAYPQNFTPNANKTSLSSSSPLKQMAKYVNNYLNEQSEKVQSSNCNAKSLNELDREFEFLFDCFHNIKNDISKGKFCLEDVSISYDTIFNEDSFKTPVHAIDNSINLVNRPALVFPSDVEKASFSNSYNFIEESSPIDQSDHSFTEDQRNNSNLLDNYHNAQDSESSNDSDLEMRNENIRIFSSSNTNSPLTTYTKIKLENSYQDISFRWPFINLTMQPQPNQRLSNNDKIAKYHKWSVKENSLLSRAIRLQNQRLLYQATLKTVQLQSEENSVKANSLHTLISNDDQSNIPDMNDINVILKSSPYNSSFYKVINGIKKLTDLELEVNVIGIDWNLVSAQFLPHRSSIDCKNQWLNHGHPSINKSFWSKQELSRLLAIANKYSFRNWPLIAEELRTNRTAADCFMQYQRCKSKKSTEHSWSPVENHILTKGIELFGEKNIYCISKCLEGISTSQCIARWKKMLSKDMRKGKWTLQEDEALVEAVRLYGKQSWCKIQNFVPGRTDIQCRERYCNNLDPNLRKGPWSVREDSDLREAVSVHGVGKWSLISQRIPGRSDNLCKRRWKKLSLASHHQVT